MYVFGTKASYGHEQHSFDFNKNEETDRQRDRQKEEEGQREGENLSRNLGLSRIQRI